MRQRSLAPPVSHPYIRANERRFQIDDHCLLMTTGHLNLTGGGDLHALAVGERTTATIHARIKWNLTGILLEAGATYELAATSSWRDWYRIAGPGGYDSAAQSLFESMRRFKEADWFALIGALDKDDSTAFVIGDGCSYSPSRDGQLCCYANDIYSMYWNNSGSVVLTVTRRA